MTKTPPAALSLYRRPNALAPHYRRFRVAERLLLTGHSHQAWPDCSFAGQQRAWLEAAEAVDGKWERAFAVASTVRAGWTRLLDDVPERIALGANTHELVVRLLSGLPLLRRPRLLTTDGEFHTVRRQFDRLAEEGVEVVRVAAAPADTLAERLAAAVDDRTSLVAVSAVLYRDARIVPGLDLLAAACEQHGTALLVDAYHALNALPFELPVLGLQTAYVVGGGYKYCQLGEGNCFLRVPPGCRLRPVVTGWYAEFDALSDGGSGTARVSYGEGGARFAGATYDPTAHYRAVEVFAFFRRFGLTPPLLREISRHQVAVLAETFDGLDLDPAIVERDRSVPLAAIGGFLALRAPRASQLRDALRARGVAVDARGDVLRFGPAPYLCDEQLTEAMQCLAEVVREGGA